MILHLLTDEKFTDYAIQQFSALKMKSEFVLIPHNGMMHYVKQLDRCMIVHRNAEEMGNLLNRLHQYSGIILHGMHWGTWQAEVLKRVPASVKVAWMFWGGEIYGRSDCGLPRYAPITNLFVHLREFAKGKDKCYDRSWELPIDLYKRVDFCLSDEREEYEFAKQFTDASFEYLWYNYYSIEETVGSLLDYQSKGNNIWLGNSAAIGNNHFDALWSIYKCSRCLKGEGHVIVPLSYGSQWVRNIVLRLGCVLLGKRMQALTEFMPREEYNALMLSCSTLIINSWTPLAQGNIITALWLGMRVYLSNRCMTYHYLKRIGCQIYSIEHDLNRRNPEVFAPMKKEDINANRAILLKWYSKAEMHKRNLEIVKALS